MSASAPDPISIRAGRPAEAAELSAIAQAAKAAWGYPADWLDEWRAALTISPEFIRDHLVLVAVDADDRPIGWIGLVPETAERWALEHLWIRPGAMRRGLGRMLVARASERARGLGVRELAIDAEPFAEPFYARIGAVRIGELDGSIAGTVRVRPQMRLELGSAAAVAEGAHAS